jgi:hypothetical protein
VTPSVTHLCCPACRVRFTPAAAAYIVACPECGDSLHPVAGLEGTFGFRLVGAEDLTDDLPCAIAVSLTPPVPGARS